MTWHDDGDRFSDLCTDLEDDRDCGCSGRDRSGHGHDRHDRHDRHDWDDWDGDWGRGRRRRRRRRRLIPIGSVTVDCTPVSFRTPGQAINVVSCPVKKILPGHPPCIATINTPPIQTPALPIFGRRKACGC